MLNSTEILGAQPSALNSQGGSITIVNKSGFVDAIERAGMVGYRVYKYGVQTVQFLANRQHEGQLTELVRVCERLFENPTTRVNITAPVKFRENRTIINQVAEIASSVTMETAERGFESNVDLNTNNLKAKVSRMLTRSDHAYARPLSYLCNQLIALVEKNYKSEAMSQRSNSAEAIALCFVVGIFLDVVNGMSPVDAESGLLIMSKMEDFLEALTYQENSTAILRNPKDFKKMLKSGFRENLAKVKDGLALIAQKVSLQNFCMSLRISAQNMQNQVRKTAELLCIDPSLMLNLSIKQNQGQLTLEDTRISKEFIDWFESAQKTISNGAPYEACPCDFTNNKFNLSSIKIFNRVYRIQHAVTNQVQGSNLEEYKTVMETDTIGNWMTTSSRDGVEYKETTIEQREKLYKSMSALFELSLTMQQIAKLSGLEHDMASLVGTMGIYSHEDLQVCHLAQQYLADKAERLKKEAQLCLDHVSTYKNTLKASGSKKGRTDVLFSLVDNVNDCYENFKSISEQERHYRSTFSVESNSTQRVAKELFNQISALTGEAEKSKLRSGELLVNGVRASNLDVYCGQRAIIKFMDDLISQNKSVISNLDTANKNKISIYLIDYERTMLEIRKNILAGNLVRSDDLMEVLQQVNMLVKRRNDRISLAYGSANRSMPKMVENMIKQVSYAEVREEIAKGDAACRANYFDGGAIKEVHYVTEGSQQYRNMLEQNEEMLKSTQNLETIRKDLATQNSDLQSKLEGLNVNIEETSSQLEVAQGKLAEAETKADRLVKLTQEWSKRLLDKLHNMQNTVNEAINNKELVHDDLIAAKDKHSILSLLLEHLKQLIAEAEEFSRDFDQDSTELKTAITKAQVSLNAATEIIKHLQGTIAELERTNKAQSETLEQLTKEVSVVKTQNLANLESQLDHAIQSFILKKSEPAIDFLDKFLGNLPVHDHQRDGLHEILSDFRRNGVYIKGIVKFAAMCLNSSKIFYNVTDSARLFQRMLTDLSREYKAKGKGNGVIPCVDGDIKLEDLWDDGQNRVTVRNVRRWSHRLESSSSETLTDKQLENYFKQNKSTFNMQNTASNIKEIVLSDNAFKSAHKDLLSSIEDVKHGLSIPANSEIDDPIDQVKRRKTQKSPKIKGEVAKKRKQSPHLVLDHKSKDKVSSSIDAADSEMVKTH